MHPAFLIVICYIFFVFLLRYTSKKQPDDLSIKEISILYGVKVIIGVIYGYIFLNWFKGDDTWYFHNGSIEEHEKLLKDPVQFFTDFNPLPAFRLQKTFALGWYYYLSDLEFWLLSKPMAIFNFISGGNYYVNSVFFNFIVFWGQRWLFQLYLKEFPLKRKTLLIAIFLVPSIVFWLSGIRGDGYIIFFLGLLLLYFYKWVNGGKNSNWIYIMAGFAGVTIFRSVLVLLLVPALLGWWITIRFNSRIFLTAAVVYGVYIFIFFGSLLISSEKNLPAFVANRQHQFLGLNGNTRFRLDSLHANFQSFVTVLPQSVNNTFLRPYPWEAKGFLQWMASLELLLFFLLVYFFVIKTETGIKNHFIKPVVLFPCLFALSLYLFIGYTIPFPGAIVRYKIPGELLLMVILFTGIQWKKY